MMVPNKFGRLIFLFVLPLFLASMQAYAGGAVAYADKCCLGFVNLQQISDTPTETPTPTASPTDTPTLTATLSGSETTTPTGSVTTSITPSPTGSITPLGTQTDTPSPTSTATGLPTGTATLTVPPTITAAASPLLQIDTPSVITATATYKPLPLITFQYPQITEAETLFMLEHQPDAPGTVKAGAGSGWIKVARLWPLGLLLVIWLGLAGWFVFAQRN